MSKFILSIVMILACVGFVSSAKAEGGPVVGIEQINVTLERHQPLLFVFDNFEDPYRPKILIFEGEATSPEGTDTFSHLAVSFGWIDPAAPGGRDSVGAGGVLLQAGETEHFRFEYTIPFCPPQVSLLLVSDQGPAEVRGVFRHECTIPTPGAALAGFALLGVMGVGRLARRHRA